MKKYFYLLFLFIFSLEACYEDKGNYDYNPIPPIEMEGIELEYPVYSMLDRLQISPQFPNKENYNFTWTLFSTTIVQAPVDTISFEPDLDYKVTEGADTYTLTLIVENKHNGDKQFFNTKVIVRTQYTTGCYILKEIDGETELDLINPEKELLVDILKNTSSRISGKPQSLVICPDINYIDEDGKPQERVKTVWINSDKDARMLTLEHMAPVYDLNTMFYEEKSGEQPRCFVKNSTSLSYLSNNGFYWNYLLIPTAAHKFGLPMRVSNAPADEPISCSCSKHVICSYQYYMFYDEANSRFLINSNGNLKCFSNTDKTNAPTSELLTPNNMNSDLIYMGNTGTNGYALMNNRTTGQLLIYRMETAEYDKYDGRFFSPLLEAKEITSDKKIVQAEIYGHNTTFPYIYYSIGNRLNLFDYNSVSESENILPGLEGRITMIKHFTGTLPFGSAREYLVVATEQGGHYKLYFHEMLAGKPDLSKEPIVIEGEGHPVQIEVV